MKKRRKIKIFKYLVIIGAITMGVQDTVAVKAFSPLNDQGYMVTESMSFSYDQGKWRYQGAGNYVYNTENNSIVYKSQDGSTYETTYFYDEDWNMVRTTWLSYEDGEKDGWEYFYDKNGNKIKDIYYSPGEEPKENQYIYDENGNVLQELMYNASGNLSLNWKYEYEIQEDVTRVKETWYDGNGQTMGHRESEMTYDSYGNEISRVDYDENGELDADIKNEYTYDEEGRIIKKIEHDNLSDTDSMVQIFVYDNNGNNTRSFLYMDDYEEKYAFIYKYEKFEQ